ncbi:MAG: SurA N-terminal domain-containing protein [Immundisolibacter sp.]
MLEHIRERAPRWLVSTILVLLVVPFALWGIGSYVQPDTTRVVARVGDSTITADALDQALRAEEQRLRASLGDAYSPQLLESAGTRNAVLQRLINRQLLLQAAAERRLQIPDQTVANLVQSVPAFAGDNGFDRARYESQLRRRGLTPLQFEDDLRQSLALQQLEAGLARSAFVPDQELTHIANLWFERRDLRVATLDWRDYVAKEPPADDAVQAYYEAHQDRFQTAEQVRVAYLELSLDALAAQVSVDDAMLQARYETMKSELSEPEQRRVRHILVQVPENATAEQVAQARHKIESLRAALLGGGDFAALAKKESDDTGSAAQGGDLGFLTRGSMTPAFDEAAFALAPDTVSEPVRTPFGFHLLQVTAVKPGTTPPLDAVRDTVRRRLQRELAEERFFSAAETLRRLTFEHPDSLAPAAEALDLEIHEIGPFPRSGGEGPAANPQFLRHAFGADALAGDNSEVFEPEPGRYAVLRVLEHSPAVVRPLAEVREAVVQQLERKNAAAAARDAGKRLLEALNAGKPVDLPFNQITDIGREGKEGLPAKVVEKAFALPVGDEQPHYAGLSLSDGSYALVAVTARRPGPQATDDEAREALRKRLQAIRAEQALNELLQTLRERHAVRVLQAAS